MLKIITTISLVEGVFDYFVFYNMLRDGNKAIFVLTLGIDLTNEINFGSVYCLCGMKDDGCHA